MHEKGEKKNEGKYIESKHLCMVNEAKNKRFGLYKTIISYKLYSFHSFIQTELNETSWRVILKELGTVEAVNDVLLVLDVVIGFLSSAGGDPEKKLTSYLEDVLKYSQANHGADHLPGKRVCIVYSYYRH